MTGPRGRPRHGDTGETERRQTTHRSLRDHVRKGWPRSVEELRAFRTQWARTFKERQLTAASVEEEDYWSTLYERWSNLAQRSGI